MSQELKIANEEEEFKDVEVTQFFERERFVIELKYQNGRITLREEAPLSFVNPMDEQVGILRSRIRQRFEYALELYNKHVFNAWYTLKEFRNEFQTTDQDAVNNQL